MTIVRTLTDAQLEAVLREVEKYGDLARRPYWRALMLLLCNYGPRVREAVLVLHDFATGGGWVDVAGGQITFPTLKRRKPTTRTLPLFQAVAQALEAYRTGVSGTPQPMPNLKSACTVAWRAWKTMLRRAGIPHIKLHATRHTVGTKLAPMDLATARDWLGHANLATTSIYVHAVRMRQVFAQLTAVV